MSRHTPPVHCAQGRQAQGRHLLIEKAVEVAVHDYLDVPGGYWARHHTQLYLDPSNPVNVRAPPSLAQVGLQGIPAPPALRLGLEPDEER